MDSGPIFPDSPAPANSGSTSVWRVCRLLPAARSTIQFQTVKITSCFSRLRRASANVWKRTGAKNSRNCRSRESAHLINDQPSTINFPLATFISNSAAETEEIGRQFAKNLTTGSVLALIGELGSGKTQFVKGLVAGLGSTAAITSPTFTIVHEYPGGRLPVYHFDFFRLEKRQSVAQLGLDDYFFGDGVSVVEWADRFLEFIPQQARWILLGIKSETTRAVALK